MSTTLAMLLFLATAADGREAALLYREGVELLEREAFDEAEQRLRRAARLAPRSPEPRYALGRLYMATDRAEEAVAAYRACLENLRRPPFRVRAAGLALESEHDASVAEFADATRAAEVHLRLGAALVRTGALSEAEESIRRSLALRATGEAHNNLAVVLFATTRFVEAEAALEAASRAGFAVNPSFRDAVRAAVTGSREVRR